MDLQRHKQGKAYVQIFQIQDTELLDAVEAL
jgi:hypothetical protein